MHGNDRVSSASYDLLVFCLDSRPQMATVCEEVRPCGHLLIVEAERRASCGSAKQNVLCVAGQVLPGRYAAKMAKGADPEVHSPSACW